MFRVEVKPPWNVGEGETGYEDWAPAFWNNGSADTENLSDFATEAEANVFARIMRWLGGQGVYANWPAVREVRVRDLEA